MVFFRINCCKITFSCLKVYYILGTRFKIKFVKDKYFIHNKYFYIQGLPFGFDVMYLALADSNMQIRFGLKVVWES